NNRDESWSSVSSLLRCRWGTTFASDGLPYVWPGRRVERCGEATRAPSQGPRPNGAARGRLLPFGIGTKAPNPAGLEPHSSSAILCHHVAHAAASSRHSA